MRELVLTTCELVAVVCFPSYRDHAIGNMLGTIMEVVVILSYPPQLQEEHKDPCSEQLLLEWLSCFLTFYIVDESSSVEYSAELLKCPKLSAQQS